MNKDSTNFDKASFWLMGYSFIFTWIFTGIFVMYLVTESILIHFNVYSNIFINYFISFALTALIHYISSHTIGSRGVMGVILKRNKVQDDNLSIIFVDALGIFLIGLIIAVILKTTLDIKISQASADSFKPIQYLIMGGIGTFLITVLIKVFVRRRLS